MLDYVHGFKSSVETFVLIISIKGKFVNVVVKTSPHMNNNVAQQIMIVMKPTRLVLKEKSYQGMKNVMGNVLKELDGFIQPVQIAQHAMIALHHSTCVME